MIIDKAEQVRRQYEAVARLARTLAKVHEQSSFMTKTADDQLLNIMGERSALIMETLGDILNEMDAVSEEDSDLDAVFEAAQAMFPFAQDAD